MKIKILINIQKPNKIPDFYKEGYKEYEKRLSRFCKLQSVYYKKDTDLKKHLKDGQKVFHLSPHSETISSENFSQKIKDLSLQSTLYSEVIFIISSNCSEIDFESFTLSKSSLSMEMEHLILLEQIYRGYKILNNESYHK